MSQTSYIWTAVDPNIACYRPDFYKIPRRLESSIGKTAMQGRRTQTNKELGWDSSFWVNDGGIANFLSIPQLEQDGYKVKYKSGGDWEVLLPDQETVIKFNRATTGVCKNMPYIDMTHPAVHFTKMKDSKVFTQATTECDFLRESGVWTDVDDVNTK